MFQFMKKDIAGEIIKLKDNSEVKLVYDLKEIKKINPKQVKEWQNEHANEYTYNNQTTPWTLKLTNEKFKQRINSIEKKDAIAVYVFNKDKLIADIGISRKDHRRNHSAGLGITVLKDYRNKGLGYIIIKKAIELTKKDVSNIKFIELGCYANNPLGITLYKKCGFKEVARIPKALQWKPPNAKKTQYIDEIIMQYSL